MKMAKSTYYFEINKIDIVAERNKELMTEIEEIFVETYSAIFLSYELIP